MSTETSIWRDLEELFLKRSYRKVKDYLNEQNPSSINFYNFAHLSQTFAALHKSNAHAESEKKVAGYALTAGLCFIETLQRSDAKQTLKWMRDHTDEVAAIYVLEDEIEQQFPASPWTGKGATTNPGLAEGFSDVTPEPSVGFNTIPSSLLSALTPQEFLALIKKATEKSCQKGEVLFREGDISNAFYVVVQGKMELTDSTGLKKDFQVGDFFGEIAVISGRPRTATIVAKTTSKLLAFSKKSFQEMLQEYPDLKKRIHSFYRLRLFFATASRMKLFRGVDEPLLEEIFHLFQPLEISQGRALTEDQLYSNKVFFLTNGQVEERHAGISLRSIGPGEFFGEEKVNSDYLAKSDCELLRCSEDSFNQILFLLRKGSSSGGSL